MKITLEQWRRDEGLNTNDEFQERVQECLESGICPALCDEGCEVEPDGSCPHGCESVLLALGII